MKLFLHCALSLYVTLLHVRTVQGLAASKVADETSLNLARWKDRWDTHTLGWHRENVNFVIQAHGDKLLQPLLEESSCTVANTRVFVPLCGKSLDLAFFAKEPRVTEVVGVDGIMKALLEFSEEHRDLELKETDPLESYRVLKGKNITLLKGDFFELKSESTGGTFTAIYDRASLVAIHPSLREKYIDIMGQLIAPGGKILLVTVEHDKGTGPPFSIMESDARSLYQEQDWVDSITQLNPNETELDTNGRLNRWYLIQK